MKKSILAASLGAVIILAGCSASPPTPDEAPEVGDVEAITAALQSEGAEVNLYWPTNDVFMAFIKEMIIPGFQQEIKDVYGLDATVNVLDAAGGDQAFLDRLNANGGNNGFTIDVSRTAPSAALLDAVDAGLLTPLDGTLITNLADIDPAGLDIFTTGGEVFGAPIYEPTMSLFFHSDSVSEAPTDLEALLEWAKDNPGEFTYEDPQANTSSGSGTMFLLAVMNAFGDVQDPSTWDDGWDYLRDLQQYVAAQPTSGSQMLDQFQRGEIEVFPYWNDGGLFAKESLKIADMSNVLLDSGFPVRFTPFVLPKGSAHPTTAQLFANYVLGPDVQTAFATTLHQIPSSQSDEVAASVDDDTFGFPLADIAAKNFPAFNSRDALEAVGQLTSGWSTEVIGRG